jgi:4-hydroxymandelate oxidase
MGLNCRVCPVCDGRACRGEVPGVGAKGSGKAFTDSVEFLRSIDIDLDAVYESRGQDTSCEMFGRTWSMPVFGAPVGGAVFNYGCKTVTDDELTRAQVGGARSSRNGGLHARRPMGRVFCLQSGRGQLCRRRYFVPTIKPWKNEKVIENLRMAEEAGRRRRPWTWIPPGLST